MNEISAVEPSRLTIIYLPVSDLIPDPRNAALPIQFSLTPKAISSRVMAGFRPPG